MLNFKHQSQIDNGYDYDYDDDGDRQWVYL